MKKTETIKITAYIPVIPNVFENGASVVGTKAIPVKQLAVNNPAKTPRLSGDKT